MRAPGQLPFAVLVDALETIRGVGSIRTEILRDRLGPGTGARLVGAAHLDVVSSCGRQGDGLGHMFAVCRRTGEFLGLLFAGLTVGRPGKHHLIRQASFGRLVVVGHGRDVKFHGAGERSLREVHSHVLGHGRSLVPGLARREIKVGQLQKLRKVIDLRSDSRSGVDAVERRAFLIDRDVKYHSRQLVVGSRGAEFRLGAGIAHLGELAGGLGHLVQLAVGVNGIVLSLVGAGHAAHSYLRLRYQRERRLRHVKHIPARVVVVGG